MSMYPFTLFFEKTLSDEDFASISSHLESLDLPVMPLMLEEGLSGYVINITDAAKEEKLKRILTSMGGFAKLSGMAYDGLMRLPYAFDALIKSQLTTPAVPAMEDASETRRSSEGCNDAPCRGCDAEECENRDEDYDEYYDNDRENETHNHDDDCICRFCDEPNCEDRDEEFLCGGTLEECGECDKDCQYRQNVLATPAHLTPETRAEVIEALQIEIPIDDTTRTVRDGYSDFATKSYKRYYNPSLECVSPTGNIGLLPYRMACKSHTKDGLNLYSKAIAKLSDGDGPMLVFLTKYSDNGEAHWEQLKIITEAVLDVIEPAKLNRFKTIYISEIHNSAPITPMAIDDNLYIWLWADIKSCSSAERLKSPVYGMTLRDCGMTDHLSIYDHNLYDYVNYSDRSEAIAGVSGNNIYTFFDLMHPDPEGIKKLEWRKSYYELWKKLILDMSSNMMLTPEEISNKAQKQFISSYKKSMIDSINNLKSEISSISQIVQSYERDFKEKYSEMKQKEDMLYTIEANKDEDKLDLRALEIIDMIKKSKLTKSVEFDKSQYLIVNTKNIFCTDPRQGNVYELGEFKIKIPFNGKTSSDIRILNQTRTVDGYWHNHNAPHVDNNGKPCWGSVAIDMTKVLTEKKFYEVYMMCLAFLETVNPADSAGAYIERWPKVESKTEEKTAEVA